MGDDVIVLEASSEDGEAINLVNEISELVEHQGYAYKDIAVSLPGKFSIPGLLKKSSHSTRFLITSKMARISINRSEVRHLLEYLRVISSPDSEEGNEALKGILNVPNRYISRKFVQELGGVFRTSGRFISTRGVKGKSPSTFPMSGRTSRSLSHFLTRSLITPPI